MTPFSPLAFLYATSTSSIIVPPSDSYRPFSPLSGRIIIAFSVQMHAVRSKFRTLLIAFNLARLLPLHPPWKSHPTAMNHHLFIFFRNSMTGSSHFSNLSPIHSARARTVRGTSCREGLIIGSRPSARNKMHLRLPIKIPLRLPYSSIHVMMYCLETTLVLAI